MLSDDPLGAKAVATMSRLQRDLPGLTVAAGLGGARVSIDGDTAITAAIVDQTVHDLSRVALAALAANLLFLMLYLKAPLAPLVLLACSLLAIAATLGLTVWLFEDTLGHDGITFYVPFAAAVVLISLGSDYNIFGIGPAWKEAQGRPLREALAVTLPQSARAIRIAAFTLAASFGLMALIPLQPFRELAFALSVGILLDAFVVRSLLAPAIALGHRQREPVAGPATGPTQVGSRIGRGRRDGHGQTDSARQHRDGGSNEAIVALSDRRVG